jgi:hypothetical protein
VGGGSNAIGLFHPFLDDTDVQMIGVEAGGHGLDKEHAAALTGGKPGILHGNKTYLLQDEDGQITEAHSISAGLDYPGIGPEHSWLHDIGRVKYLPVTDDRRWKRSSSAAAGRDHPRARIGPCPCRAARSGAQDGQGSDHHRQCLRPRRQGHFHRCRQAGSQAVSARLSAAFAKGRPALVTFITGGDPRRTPRPPSLTRWSRAARM